jgi:hypothetical protein
MPTANATADRKQLKGADMATKLAKSARNGPQAGLPAGTFGQKPIEISCPTAIWGGEQLNRKARPC